MAEKDIAEKLLESYNDVFADIVNVLLFNGRQLIKANELSEASPVSHYKVSGSLHEQERDVAKYWKNGNIRICLYGFENQTAIDNDMPFRVINYDGAAYRAQISAGTQTKRFPVITLVLYFGEARWKKPRTLFDRLEIPAELRSFVSDYKINVFEIAWLEPETVKLFRSDFRIVADYFVQMHRNRDYVPSEEVLNHVHETLQLLSVLTGDNRFSLAQENTSIAGGATMCEVLDKIEGRGIAIGKEQGQNDVLELFRKLFSDGRSVDVQKATTDRSYLKKLFDEYQR